MHQVAVFLDRDGVLNELVERSGQTVSPRVPSDFRLFDDATSAVARLRALQLRVFVVTNQPDLSRGLMDGSALIAMTDALRRALDVDEVLVCGHDDSDACACRKPAPGMLIDLAHRWRVDLSASFVIGDTWKDIEAGRRAGCRTVLLQRSSPADGTFDASGADVTVGTLPEAVQYIEQTLDRRNA